MNGKKTAVVSGLLVALSVVLIGCQAPLEDRAKEYLTKYDDTFTYVDKKENNGSNTYYFTSQKFPADGVSVHYEGAFESLGREPFSDNYASLMLGEDGLEKGRELVESAFPGENYEISRSRGEYTNYFDKDSTFDEYYSAMGSAYGVVLHKQASEEVLKADAEKLQEVLNGEKNLFQMATAKTTVRIYYYSDDAAKLVGNDFTEFDKLSGYDAVLEVSITASKGESEVEKSEMSGQ